jgi:hypothetical protein
MANRSYNPSGIPLFKSAGASVSIRNEFAAISAGMAELESELDSAGTQVVAGEWVDPAYTLSYINSTSFKCIGVNAVDVLVQHRRLRCTINGNHVYNEIVSSSFAGGDTTVTVLSATITNLLTLVEYAGIMPYGATACPLSLAHLQSIISSLMGAVSSLVEVDTSSGDVVVTLPSTSNHVSYVKTTDDANQMSWTTSDGSVLADEDVSVSTRYSPITFDRAGDIWYKS